jgi:NAD(P)-dependent dehydrogenase (short-subunit alcohol dehydrogenase family)
METHLFGTLAVVRAFAPVLAANGGGAILNVNSILSWLSYDGANAYAAAKAAEWSLTNGVRLELARQGTQVTGLFVGSVDTGMMAGLHVEKSDPAEVVCAALDGLQAGDLEVLADEATVQAKSRRARWWRHPQAAAISSGTGRTSPAAPRGPPATRSPRRGRRRCAPP